MQKEFELPGHQQKIMQSVEREFGLTPVAVACDDEDLFMCVDIPSKEQWKHSRTVEYVALPTYRNAAGEYAHAVRVDTIKQQIVEECSWMTNIALRDVKCVYLLSTSIDDVAVAVDPRLGFYVKKGTQYSPLFVVTLSPAKGELVNGVAIHTPAPEAPVAAYMLFPCSDLTPDGDLILEVFGDRLKTNDGCQLTKSQAKATVKTPASEKTFESVYIGKHPGQGRLTRLTQSYRSSRRSARDTDAS